MPHRFLALSHKQSLLAVSPCGFVLALSAPPEGWLWASWIGMVPLIVLARRETVTPRQAFELGLVAALGIGMGGFPWIAEMLVNFARVPGVVGFLGLLVFSLWMGIPYGLWALALRCGPRRGWAGPVWALCSYVGLQQVWPNLFPYTFLLGFADRPEWIQLAEIGGVHLVEAAVVCVWLLWAEGLCTQSARRRALAVALAAAIPACVFAQGAWRMEALQREAEGAATLRIGLVQPNTPIGFGSPGESLRRLREPSARLERDGAELIVWPEGGAYPYRVSRPLQHDRQLGSGRVQALHRAPTLFGAGSIAPGDRYGYNSAYLMARGGAVVGRYDKVNLVPLGEEIPIIPPSWVTDRIPEIAHHHRGETTARFVLERDQSGGRSVALAPLICYEDIIPDYVREVAAQSGGVELFVNVTIDAWYGDSAEPWEHLALAQFRSVEHRIPLVRSVSTGVSAVVDWRGVRVDAIAHRYVQLDTVSRFPAETLIADVALVRNTAAAPTVFARGGWLFPHLCQLAAVGMALRHWRATRTALA